MAYEIKQIIIKAFVGDHDGKNDKKTSEDNDKPCSDNKETHEKQDTMDAVSDMMKNEKER